MTRCQNCSITVSSKLRAAFTSSKWPKQVSNSSVFHTYLSGPRCFLTASAEGSTSTRTTSCRTAVAKVETSLLDPAGSQSTRNFSPIRMHIRGCCRVRRNAAYDVANFWPLIASLTAPSFRVFFSDDLRTKFLYLVSIGLHDFSSPLGVYTKDDIKGSESVNRKSHAR